MSHMRVYANPSVVCKYSVPRLVARGMEFSFALRGEKESLLSTRSFVFHRRKAQVWWKPPVSRLGDLGAAASPQGSILGLHDLMPSSDHTAIAVQPWRRNHAGRFLQGFVGCHGRGRGESLGWKSKTRPRQGPKITHAPRPRDQTGSQIIQGVERLGRSAGRGPGAKGPAGAVRCGAGRGREPIKARPEGAERSDGARRRPGRAPVPAWPGRERPRAGITSRSFAAGTHGPKGGAAGEGGARPHSQGPQHLQSAVAGRCASQDPTPREGARESRESRERGQHPGARERERGRLLCESAVTCGSKLLK